MGVYRAEDLRAYCAAVLRDMTPSVAALGKPYGLTVAAGSEL